MPGRGARRLAGRHRIGPARRGARHAARREVRRRRAQLHARALRRLRALPPALRAEERLAVGRAGGTARHRGAGDVARSEKARPPGERGQRTTSRRRVAVMLAFVLLSAALTIAAVAAVMIPLLRPGAPGGMPAPWAALRAGVLLVVGSAALYFTWSNWPWPGEAVADSPQAMVGRLARRMESDPSNLQGWLQLGNAYLALQEYHLALRAFEKADQLSGEKSADALTGEAEALALNDESELDGRAGRLIER